MAKKVKVYALSTCIHCKKTKEFLDSKGIKYDCVHVDQLEGDERKEAVAEVKKHNPAASFPTVLIGDDCVIVGHQQSELERHLGS